MIFCVCSLTLLYNLPAMKTNLPLLTLAALTIIFSAACSRKTYTSNVFEQQSLHHRRIAILPAEMIYTGTQPKGLTPEDIERIEVTESKAFQYSLFNGILRYANTRHYTTYVTVQEISTTLRKLEENNISVKQSWTSDDKQLASILEVDAIVRLRVQKKRYMSDLASMGVSMGRQVIRQIGQTARIPVPNVSAKTHDILVSCNVVSDNQTLWNNYYKGTADYNRPSEEVIDNITDNFGRNFPYRRKR